LTGLAVEAIISVAAVAGMHKIWPLSLDKPV